MADEIIALTGNTSGTQLSVLMIFPLDPAKIVQVNGVNVIPTPSGQLTSREASLVSTEHKTSLDAGTSVFRRITLDVFDNDTPSTLQTKAQERYTRLAPLVQRAYDKTYRFIGATLNAPT